MIPSRTRIAAMCLLLLGATTVLAQEHARNSISVATEGPLLVKPYLQLGYTQAQRQLEVVWHTNDSDSAWSVEYCPGTGRRWETASPPSFQRVAVAGIEAHRVYHVPLTALEPGQSFAYRLHAGGKVVFEAEARAPKAPDQRHPFRRLRRLRCRHA